MPDTLTLSRAARLAGVSRGELQQKILDEGLATFEGRIRRETLLQVYPELDLDRDPAFERVQSIKAHARPKLRYGDNWMPEASVLMARLQDFQQVLARTKSSLNTATALIGEVIEQLAVAGEADNGELRRQVLGIQQRLARSLEVSEGHQDREAELFAKDAMLRIISASVRVLPSGHEFFVQGHDSLLDAALKAGLHMNYGCASGNCGACRVRVRAGQTQAIREHDYLLSEQEQQEGWILACSHTAVTDLLLEGIEAHVPADLPQQRVRCSVEDIQPVSESLILLQLKTPRTHTLRFMAGQRIILTQENGLSRDLPLASCPCDAQHLQFLLPAGDEFADSLLGTGRHQTLDVAGPLGEFLLQEDSLRPAIFIGVDAGMGPIKSLAEHAIAIDNAVSLSLYRKDDAPPDSPIGNLCRSWNDALDNFDYQRLPDDATADSLWEELQTRHTNLRECLIYLAGPADWVEAFSARFAAAEETHEERLFCDLVQ